MSHNLSPESAAFLTTSLAEIQMRTRDMNYEALDFADPERSIDAEQGVLYVCNDSLLLLDMGYQELPTPPTTTIAKMTVRLTEHPDMLPIIEEFAPEDLADLAKQGDKTTDYESALDAIGCLEAEPRLAHSLTKQHDRVLENHPACVLFDATGKPFAYQKGNGKPLAFTWRDAYLNTADGAYWVPQDAIIRPLYQPGHDPRVVHAGRGVLAITSPKIMTAHFLRFNTASWLSPELAQAASRVACERVVAAGLHEADIQMASVTSGQRLGEKVMALLTSGEFLEA